MNGADKEDLALLERLNEERIKWIREAAFAQTDVGWSHACAMMDIIDERIQKLESKILKQTSKRFM